METVGIDWTAFGLDMLDKEQTDCLSADAYQELAMRTRGALRGGMQMNCGALGLAGESGEVADLIKKALYHDRDVLKSDIALELGDVLWYVALLCDSLGIRMSQVMSANIRKLQKRYPDGFRREAAAERRDEPMQVPIPVVRRADLGLPIGEKYPYYCNQCANQQQDGYIGIVCCACTARPTMYAGKEDTDEQ
jgi:NTP pyrophosphatase (non-canonical NTP hydrolase)